jgi:sulfite reductase (ferredoxin)
MFEAAGAFEAMSDDVKLSPVEAIKLQSRYLRGTIAEDLLEEKPNFSKENAQLLKHHGSYQQDNRDERAEIRAAGGGKSEKAYIFMVRTRVPGGKLTCDQVLAELDLADELGNTTLRITSRQGLQLHGVLKRNLRQVIRRINEVQLTTLAACGDVERNVMCCPAPHYHDPVHAELQALADRLAAHLAPRTKAYHDIWLKDLHSGEQLVFGPNGEPTSEEQEVEPIYGATYLPRKFKTAIGLPGDNCVDIYANDLGFLAICKDWRVVGYNVLVGGGMGVTPSAKKTFPALAMRMAFCTPEQAVDVATAVIKVQRDHGNRSDRKVARLKYLLADRGLPWFKARVEEYLGYRLPEPDPEDVWGFDDHMGWHEQGDGRLFYGLNIENGRILDREGMRLKTALREVARSWRPSFRLTPHQSLLICDLPAGCQSELEGLLHAHGVKLSSEISAARRWSMACVAWPTCGLSITEAERALPGVIDQLEVELARLGLSQEVFTIRMTGCPNGCARPYNCDVGLVGRTADKYTVFLGGRLLGNRLNFMYKDLVPTEELVATLVPPLAYFKQARQPGETFGDFCARKGRDDLLAFAARYEAQLVG